MLQCDGFAKNVTEKKQWKGRHGEVAMGWRDFLLTTDDEHHLTLHWLVRGKDITK